MLFLAAVLLTCSECHRDIVQRWLQSPMGQTSGVVNPSSEKPGEIFHPGSRTQFEVSQAGDTLEVRWGHQKETLAYYIGSGRMGRSYVLSENEYLYQAPIGYYGNRHLWDMAPGYERDPEPDFTRPITDECLFCHASPARPAPGTLNQYSQPAAIFRGIGCERCHGDGSRHMQNPQRTNIVNPAHLSGAARDSVCEQCHLTGEARVLLPGKDTHDYRPEFQLADFVDVFVSAGGSRGVRVSSHAEALTASRCKQASGDRLWCGTCHDPHAQTVDYRAKCLSCHEAKHGDDCIGCHMPKARAADGGHTVFTDHSIPRRPPKGVSKPIRDLRAYYSRQLPTSIASRDLGLAYAELGKRDHDAGWLQRAWPLLRNAIQTNPQDSVLDEVAATLLQADGHTPEAIALYRMSLAEQPDQFDAVVNLARLLPRESVEAATLRGRAIKLCPRQAARAGSPSRSQR
jgi:hypothetical protein